MANHSLKNYGWKPGQSGNPAGRAPLFKPGSEELLEIQEVSKLARKYSKQAIERLAHLFLHGKTETVQMHCAIAILDRGCGRPPQFSTSNAEEFRKVTELKDSELEAVIKAGIEKGLISGVEKKVA